MSICMKKKKKDQWSGRAGWLPPLLELELALALLGLQRVQFFFSRWIDADGCFKSGNGFDA